MGFLKKFIKNTFRDGQPPRGASSFENLSEAQLETHLKVSDYDGFTFSKEDVIELFMDLLDPIGSEVDVVLETSHDKNNGNHDDMYREHIDLPILKSILYDFEEMLLNDGCTGIAVLNPRVPVEVQFDEHKLLIIYGHDLSEFEAVLNDHGLECDDEIKFITEAEHVHSSSDEFSRQFEEMKYRLGIDDC